MTIEELNYIRVKFEECKTKEDRQEFFDTVEQLITDFGGSIELTTLRWLMNH